MRVLFNQTIYLPKAFNQIKQFLLVILFTMALSACGNKGDLYIPKNESVTEKNDKNTTERTKESQQKDNSQQELAGD